MPAFGTTGDGIVTGLRLMSRMAQTRTSLAALAEPMQTLPQVLINVEVADKATVAEAPSVRTAVAEAEAGWATPAESCCGPPELSRWFA